MAGFEPKPFGEYYLLERVAVGGMAEIFKAKTYGVGGFEKLLAIKRVLPHHAQNQEFISMLIDEAKIAVALNHVNIVQVYDLGKIENDYFIAMEFVEGRDLRSVMRRCKKLNTPLSIENTVYIILEICKGLDYAHRKTDRSGKDLSIVHRDISPQNILISFEGEVKIVDFGIAKAANKISETDAGILKGKFSYMSPEQASGKKVQQQTDIFSTGIMMYELITGEKLFTGQNHLEILDKIKNFQIEPPFLPADVPSELEFILSGALESSLEDRYANASDFQVELTKFLYSASLDFTARNLSQLMHRLFQNEIEADKNRDKVDFELDEITRSVLLQAHSHSLVSKTDLAVESSRDEDFTGTGQSSHSTKNRTIIKKFRKILRQNQEFSSTHTGSLILEKNTVADPSDSTQTKNSPVQSPAPPEKLLEEITERIAIDQDDNEYDKEDDYLAEDTASLDLNEVQKKEKPSATGFSWMNLTPVQKIKYLIAFSTLAIFMLTALMGIIYIVKTWHEGDVANPTPGNPAPSPIAKIPATPTGKTYSYPRANFDPNELHKDSAKLILISEPSAARVSTGNNRYLGITPLVIDNILPGLRFDLSFELDNYHTLDKWFILNADEAREETYELDPLMGFLELNSTPSRAYVYLDNVKIGETPLLKYEVPPNKLLSITLKKTGYETATLQLEGIKPEESVKVTKVLDKARRILLVESFPKGADIYLNGQIKGTTPTEIKNLESDVEYDLIIRLPGYHEYHDKINLDTNEPRRVKANLEQQTGQWGAIRIVSTPSGATLMLDGKILKEKTPAYIDRISTRDLHTLKVELDYYEPVKLLNLQVRSDQTLRHQVNLVRLKGRITITSDPPNAKIFINNTYQGETPKTLNLDCGLSHNLELKKEGHKSRPDTITLENQQKINRNYRLDPLEPQAAVLNP